HITSLFDEMEKELKCHDLVNNLKIGATIATGTYFMPKYVEKFAEIRPGIKINVYIENSKVIENKLLTNELDLAIIDGIIHSENIISDPILDDKLVIICSPKNPLAQKETVSLEEIKNQNFLLRERGSGTRELFDSILFSRGITIEPLWESISTRALVIAVQQNIGIAVLPYYLVKEELEKKIVSRVRIKNIKFVRKFNIIHHKNKYLSSSAISFIEMCKNMEK
ncbi:MAG: LysR substrate-binding domain-containing protein, partial [Fusobacterium sp.]|nr:LysR substrate-binding domain-containing protein [Fusobacterium sp.]